MSMAKGAAKKEEFAKAPFPYFGGKTHCSSLVWEGLGDVDSYSEPFAGSIGVLLQRPHYPFTDGRIGRVELINDKDHFVSNFWRAVKHDPEEVVYHIDNPVNERDLESRHYWLVTAGAEELRANEGDPDFFNAKTAGWWAWGACNWIGTGWCSGSGGWVWQDGEWQRRQGDGVNRKIPHLANTGKGVGRQVPHLGNTGMGVSRQVPHLANNGRGVGRQVPHLSDTGVGVSLASTGDGLYAAPREFIRDWIHWLCNRLRYVRVIQGEWDRALSDSALGGVTMKHHGIFLDPPYSVGEGDFYRHGDEDLSAKVREWAIERGENPAYRIVFAGYDSEDHLFPDTWRKEHWKYKGGYSSTRKEQKETLWFSPHCNHPQETSLF